MRSRPSSWAGTACGTKRLDNDVSAVGDPYTGFDIYDSYVFEPSFTPGWLTVGGTSLSSPLVSGLYALAGGSHGVAYPASTLYARSAVASSFYDVAKGGNGYCDGEAAAACGEPSVASSTRSSNPHCTTPTGLTCSEFGLFPVRSPLLGESRLIPVPQGTEMFQFPHVPRTAL